MRELSSFSAHTCPKGQERSTNFIEGSSTSYSSDISADNAAFEYAILITFEVKHGQKANSTQSDSISP